MDTTFKARFKIGDIAPLTKVAEGILEAPRADSRDGTKISRVKSVRAKVSKRVESYFY